MEPKDFRQRRPDGNGGWIKNLKGVERVLYHLPSLLAADPSQPIFIVEGEKDVDRLTGLGLTATCNSGGAGKWRDEYSDALRNRNVVIFPDNDDAGREHAVAVACSLLGIAASIKVVAPPEVGPKGDISDWLRTDGTASDVLAMTEETPEWEPAKDADAHDHGEQIESNP